MELPETSMLNIFNKVLISLSDLTIGDDSCSITSLVNQCKSVVFGAQIGDYDLILTHCQNCGLLRINHQRVSISVLGQKFMDANREHYFEINDAQKQIVADRIVFKGAWNHFARELFSLFSLNSELAQYEISIEDNLLNNRHRASIHFFNFLGIIHQSDVIVRADKRYSEYIYRLTSDSKAISEQQLEKMLFENKKLGAQAEIAVVEFEKARLRKLGKDAQAELVKRISPINEGAGFDVESFDGTSDDIFPNRFIEVKATQRDEIRFYWSNNERKIAKKRKNSYWIYMLKEFKEDRPQEAVPIMIQNPEKAIKNSRCLSLEAYSFLITEYSEVELNEKNIEEIKWYYLD